VIRLEEVLEEILAEGDRVLCFTQFTEFGEMLVSHLAARFGRDVAYLHGGTPKKRATRWWHVSSPVTGRRSFCYR
jgi:SNF2 family DNA or RNA helicase